ncbi:RNA helicase [Bertholletia excelsa]
MGNPLICGSHSIEECFGSAFPMPLSFSLNSSPGRAGRYASQFSVGEVTCLHANDMPLLHSSLESPSPTLKCAGLFPAYDLLFMYSRLHPKIRFHQILVLDLYVWLSF